MPLFPVPRWLHYSSYKVVQSYSDALPKGWDLSETSMYEFDRLTLAERAANLYVYGNGRDKPLHVFRRVPAEEWTSLSPDRFHLVKARIPTVSNFWEPWQWPEYWGTDTGLVSIPESSRPIRVDWQTFAYELIRPAAVLQLEQYFERQKIAFDFREPPSLIKDGDTPSDEDVIFKLEKNRENFVFTSEQLTGSGARPKTARPEAIARGRKEWIANLRGLRERQRLADIERFKREHGRYPIGGLHGGMGYPRSNQQGIVEFLAGANATVGQEGEVCFVCNARDLFEVYEHVRTVLPRK